MSTPRHRAGAALLLVASVVVPVVLAGPTASGADDAAGYGRMILLLDSSGSMAEPAGGGRSRSQAARAALASVVDTLPPEAEVGLRVFGAQVFSRTDPGACTDSQLVVAPDTDNRPQLAAAIGAVQPYGETPIPHALEEAARDLGDEGPRAIVLVSDGESTCDPDPCEVADRLRADGIDLHIDVVGLSVSGPARQQLQCIAEKGGGTYYDADSAADIESRLIRVAQRAVRPFTLDGEPIVGGPAGSPTPVEAGEYTDTLGTGGDSKSYVFTRDTSGTTLRVAAVSQGERGFIDGLVVEVVGPDGRCDYANVTRFLDVREVMGVQVTAGADTGAGPSVGCDGPGDYVVTVTRGLGATEAVPFGLVLAEEQPVADPGFVGAADVDVTVPRAAGPAQAVEGGASFGHATEIGAGTWSSTVVPGESLLYRVPLDYGQAAKVSVVFPKAAPGIAEQFGRFPPNAHLGLFNPLGAQLGYADGSTWLGRPDDLTLLTATGAVSREPSDARSDQFNGGADYTLAGDYYLSVSVQQEDYTVEIPFTLAVEVVGDPAPGPTYVDDATEPAEGAPAPGEPDPDESGEPASDGDPAEASGVPVAVLAAVLGGLVLVGLAGIVVLRRGRRG
jgi:Ca-activated chloride channel family protein